MARNRARRAVVLLAGALALGAVVLLWPTQLGGVTTYVSTYGSSMEPGLSAGDLVVVRTADEYEVGDAAAYRSGIFDTVVLHRIVEVEAGRYTLQGDNNSWLDPEHPGREDLLGKPVLHVPAGGTWLSRLSSPPGLGLLALGLLTTGGTAARSRRRRRRTVSQQAGRTARTTTAGPTSRRGLPTSALPPWVGTVLVGALVVAALGLALGTAAFSRPAAPGTGAPGAPAAEDPSMSFSYSAEVPRSPAYDGTTVTAPAPVFRTLTDIVRVGYAYRGAPGVITVAAELSAASGWRSTVPLDRTDTDGATRFDGTVTLDLKDLQQRARAAARTTAIAIDEVQVTVVPTVTTAAGEPFAPELPLVLTPLQLRLVGDEASLDVASQDVAAQEGGTGAAPTLDLLGQEVEVATARTTSVSMVLAGVLAAGVVLALGRRTGRGTESASIHRRYGALLVAVEPMPAPVGRPIIDVVDFCTLARLAERYELLVLHWTRSDVETFLVQDQAVTYRYRTTGPGALDEGVAPDVTEPADPRDPAPRTAGPPAG